MSVIYLDLEGVLQLHNIGIQRHGGTSEIISIGGLRSCLAQPQQALFGEEIFPTLSDKAAAYLFYIATAQHFADGNKRTALLCCKMFLQMNGLSLNLSEQEEEDLVMNVAEKKISLEELRTKISVLVSSKRLSSL